MLRAEQNARINGVVRIALQTLGTRGDVQPYLALAVGLLRRGHEVQLAAPAQFEAMVSDRGVGFAPLPAEFLALLDTAEGKKAVAGGQGFGAGLRLLKRIRPLMRRLLDEEWAAVRSFGPDLIVHHPKSLASPHIGQRLDRPVVLASPLPGFTPTSEFPSPMLPFRSLGPLNRASHALAIHGGDLLFGGMIREWRETVLGLRGGLAPPRPRATLYAYSPHVVPVPRDWGDDVLVSGYWFLDGGSRELPADLAAFLASGDPPVYVGFGSMPGLDPQKLASTVVSALSRMGKRGVLATGSGALARDVTAAHVFVIEQVPHETLFGHVAATIHHGGAGTTAASLRAGLPMTICPFFGDQPFWARRIAALGAGPPPLDRRRLDVDTVAAAVSAMHERSMRARAAELGAAIRAEDGVNAAISFLEQRMP